MEQARGIPAARRKGGTYNPPKTPFKYVEPVSLSSHIYIRLTSAPTVRGFASCVEVSLKRSVRIMGDDSVESDITFAAVWHKRAILTGNQFAVFRCFIADFPCNTPRQRP